VAASGKTRADSGSVALLDAPTPPHSIEAEQAVLGGLLLDPLAWDNVADAVTQEPSRSTLSALASWMPPAGLPT
jgi:hypothetical protein